MSEATTEVPVLAPTPGRRPRWPILVAVLVAAVVGLTIGIVVVSNNNDAPSVTTAAPAAQIANVQQACQQWMNDYNGSAPSADWCRSMATWMTGRVGNGQTMPMMMWGDPDQMASTCRQWNSGNDDWCDQMVTWMQGHMNGEWNQSMMNGWNR